MELADKLVMRHFFKHQTLTAWSLLLGLLLCTSTVTGQEAGEAAAEQAEANTTETDPATKKTDTKPPEVYLAAKHGRLSRLQKLIEQGADINASNAMGRTALMGAIYFRNTRVVKELLIEGADVNAKDNNGRTALMIAVNRQDMELTGLLLDAGADVSVADNKNKTALTIAETLKDKELTKMLEAAKTESSE